MRLVSRSDVITAQSLGYLLTEREKDGGEERRGGVGQEEEKKKKKSLKCDSDHNSLTHFSVVPPCMHTHIKCTMRL